MDEVQRLVRRLREEPGFSRNRHFDELSKPAARRARRLLRRLDGIGRELRAGAVVEVERCEGGYRMIIDFPSVRARRIAYLSAEEHALLASDEQLRRVLDLGAA